MIAIALIFANGMYFSIKLAFPQINIKKIINSFKKKNNEVGISVRDTLMMSLAGKIGVGSLAGISLALYIGGPGTIFWMWIGSFIISINAFLEGMLSIIYKEKDGNYYKSGPYFYIKNGLNKNKLSIVYAILTLITYIVCFLTIQANTMTTLTYEIFKVNKIVIALVITILSFMTILKGLKTIAYICSKMVPIMAYIYIIIGVIVIFKNSDIIIDIFKFIISSAFNFKSLIGGALYAFYIGIQKSIFANEAGIGTGAISSGTTSSSDYIRQGYTQVIGVYFVTLIIITITAIIVLTSNYQILNFTNLNGIEIIKYAFSYHLGSLGDLSLFVILILFSFSTIIAGYYYGESSLKFLNSKVNNKTLLFFKLITCVILFWGALSSPNIIWNLVNISTGILAIINTYAIYKLKDKIMKYYGKI